MAATKHISPLYRGCNLCGRDLKFSGVPMMSLVFYTLCMCGGNGIRSSENSRPINLVIQARRRRKNSSRDGWIWNSWEVGIICHYNHWGSGSRHNSRKVSPKNLNAGSFKLVFCPSSDINLEIVSSYPPEIWQPWLSNFGNPEKQNSDSWVFKLAEQ